MYPDTNHISSTKTTTSSGQGLANIALLLSITGPFILLAGVNFFTLAHGFGFFKEILSTQADNAYVGQALAAAGLLDIIFAFILGWIALNQIKQTPHFQGRSKALAAIWISAGFFLLACAAFVFLFI